MNTIVELGEAAFLRSQNLTLWFVMLSVEKWQLGTIQVDYNLPERFQLEYIGADNTPHRPVMISPCAFLAQWRDFVAILIEHYAGNFPFWIAPVQVCVMPISDKKQRICRKTC